MSAIIELHCELKNRMHIAVLQTIMQSGRASVLEKQEAELTMLRDNAIALRDRISRSDDRIDEMNEHNVLLEDLVLRAITKQRRMDTKMQELVDNYWSLIDTCMEVVDETKENARGQKRKLPAAEQIKKMEKILIEHNGKRARMVVDGLRGAGSSTDH